MNKKILLFIMLGILYVFYFHLAFSLDYNPQVYCREKYGEDWKYRGISGGVPEACYNGEEVKSFSSIEENKVCSKPQIFQITKWKTECKF